jgi:hypothetical protein
MELTGEGGLIRIAAFERHSADRRSALAQAIASAVDPRSGKILPRRKAKQSPDALIELKDGQSRARRKIGDP